MRLFVTGATGFIGTALVPSLLEAGHEVVALVRPAERAVPLPAPVRIVEGDPGRPGPWTEAVATCGGAVNLAGAPIFCRWTPEAKKLIFDSRIDTTRRLVEAIPPGRPFTLVSTSAVGIYGDAGEAELDESSPFGTDFLAGVARAWEREALTARERGVRTVIARFAVVLGPGGGALGQLVKATRDFVGGPIGSGRQWFSWIHRQDLLRALAFLLEHPEEEGVFNVCSPNPVRQIEMARALARILHRPAALRTPAFAVRLALGEFANALLFSQRMVPRRLLEAGFSFRFPDVDGALAEILRDQSA